LHNQIKYILGKFEKKEAILLNSAAKLLLFFHIRKYFSIFLKKYFFPVIIGTVFVVLLSIK